MKKIISVIAFLTIIITSCDIIEGPYKEQDNSEETKVVFPELNKDSVIRKVLIEEFTGHRCTNCPEKGHRVVEELCKKYGEILVPVAIHATSLAAPKDEPFNYDFRTEEGNTLSKDFGATSVPCAMINRSIKNEKYISFFRDWDNLIANVDKNKIVAAIQLINEYNKEEKTLKAHSKTTILSKYDNPIMISSYLIEDEFVSPQIDNSDTILNYAHHHVLRGSLNGTYGAYLNTKDGGMVQKDSAYTKTYNMDFKKLSSTINFNKCRVVTFIYDATTKEILQVETRKIED